MKQINRYRLCGTVMVDVYIDIDAPTLEDAIEYAENNIAIEEYANGTIGVEDGGYNFGDGEITCCDYINWAEDYCECTEEDVEDENEIWNSDNEEEDEDE